MVGTVLKIVVVQCLICCKLLYIIFKLYFEAYFEALYKISGYHLNGSCMICQPE
jgi:hypothetical protein